MPLDCPVPPLRERLPLVPGKRQRWTVAMRAPTEAAAVRALPDLFARWHALFPGSIGEPSRVPLVAPGNTITPPNLSVRAPQQVLGVEFDYNGSDDSMIWPTLVQRRRERIDPLCPVDPVDAMPVAVQLSNLPDTRGDDLVEPPHGAEDPFGIDPPDLPDVLWPAAGGIGLALAGVGIFWWLTRR